MAQICEYDVSKIPSSISMETQIPQERKKISWKLRNFSEFCPPGVEEFKRIASPEFSAGTEVGKPSIWMMSLSGDKGFISFGLNLLKSGFSEEGEQSYCPSAIVSGSATLILKNAEGMLLNVTRLAKFEFGPENTTLKIRKLIPMASIRTARSSFEIPIELHFDIVLDIYGDPVGQVVQRGVKRSASEHLAIGYANDDEIDDENDEENDDEDDILVECEEYGFPVHKSILSAKSKRFAAMLSSGSAGIKQNKLQLHDLDSVTAGTLFNFIYTEGDEFPESLTVDEAQNILGAAKTYEVKDLISKTFSVLCEDLDTENYFEVVALFKEYGEDSGTQEFLDSFYKQNRRALNRLGRRS